VSEQYIVSIMHGATIKTLQVISIMYNT